MPADPIREAGGPSRADAERAMAALHAERLACELPFRDLSAYRDGNTGIAYAFSFDSGRAGPHVVISGLSHGNEPGGRDAVTTLIDKVRPVAGKLSLVLLNLDAYHASNGVDPYGTRFVETDFNRVWNDAIIDGDASTIEIRRAREVRPLIASADVLLDIHSTPYEATPFFVLKPGSKGVALAEALGAPRTRILFEQGSVHQPTITNYNRFADPASPAVALSVETGLFFSQTSGAAALSTAIRLLRLKGLIGPEDHEDLVTWSDPGPIRRVRVLHPEIVATNDIALSFRPEAFRPYPAGEIVAYDADRPIRAPFEGAVPLWIKQKFEAGIQAFMWARLEPETSEATRAAPAVSATPVDRAAAEANMAQLVAARLDCQIPFRDLSAYREGNTGIPHAFSFDSGRPGPHVLVAGLSHGNEPGGAEAVITLIDKVRPVAGRLSLVLLNVAAHAASNGVDPYGTRFVETDLNRVWDDALLDSDLDTVEVRRAREVRPLVATADIVLDLHATPFEPVPYFVLRPGAPGNGLAEALGLPRTQLMFEQGSVHGPYLSNYRQFSDPASGALGLTVETGLFFSRESAAAGLATALGLLRHKGLIPAGAHAELAGWSDPGPARRITILHHQVVRTADVALLYRSGEFRPRAAGEIVAYDGDTPIVAPFDGAIPIGGRQTFEAGIAAFMWGRQEAGQ